MHHVDRPWLLPASPDPSVQAYSHSPFTVLVSRHEPFASPNLLASILHYNPSAWIFRLTFTSCCRLPCPILHMHITRQEIHQLHTMLSITHHPRVTTISALTLKELLIFIMLVMFLLTLRKNNLTTKESAEEHSLFERRKLRHCVNFLWWNKQHFTKVTYKMRELKPDRGGWANQGEKGNTSMFFCSY